MIVDAHMHIWSQVHGMIGNKTPVTPVEKGRIRIGDQEMLGMPAYLLDCGARAEFVVAEFDARFALLAGPERDGKLLLLLLNDQLTYGVHVLDIASGEIQNGPAGVAVVGWLP